jgi:hypothetical protein
MRRAVCIRPDYIKDVRAWDFIISWGEIRKQHET